MEHEPLHPCRSVCNPDGERRRHHHLRRPQPSASHLLRRPRHKHASNVVKCHQADGHHCSLQPQPSVPGEIPERLHQPQEQLDRSGDEIVHPRQRRPCRHLPHGLRTGSQYHTHQLHGWPGGNTKGQGLRLRLQAAQRCCVHSGGDGAGALQDRGDPHEALRHEGLLPWCRLHRRQQLIIIHHRSAGQPTKLQL